VDSDDLPQIPITNLVHEPAWRVRELYQDGTVISFRHPEWGWLHFSMAPADAGTLGRWLLAHCRV
jgi:hypothetical protein